MIKSENLTEVCLFLQSKKYSLNDYTFLHNGREEFDFDWYQEYYTFLLHPTNKSHAKLLVVRRVTNLGNCKEFTLERMKLVKVP